MNIEFKYPLKIREHHLDTFGHVNNAVYLEILEEARWEIVNQRGYGLDKIRATGQGPVILDIHMRFAHELRLLSEVVVHTQIVSYEGKIAELKHWITDSKERRCFEADFKAALFDLKARKIVDPTPEWLFALGIGG